jgi:RHS repeat-associated protein
VKEKDSETTAGAYDFGARIYDGRLGRWMSVDGHHAKYAHQSPYGAMECSPIYLNDRDGNDAVVTIVGNTINIACTIQIYGADATNALASKTQNDILRAWSGQTYTDPTTGTVYNVNFDVKVIIYEGVERNESLFIPETYDPTNRDNFIEVKQTDENTNPSHVWKGDEGVWSTSDLANFNGFTAAHEFGHLLGLADQYVEGPKDENGNRTSTINSGWEGNIMGEYGGDVQQRNIDALAAPLIVEYNEYVTERNEIVAANKQNFAASQAYGIPYIHNEVPSETYNTEIDEDECNK